MIKLKCDVCTKEFSKKPCRFKRSKNHFCSKKCSGKYKITSESVNCLNCNVGFKKQICEIKKFQNHFCSRSCAATYHNTHKTTGNRRSKLEKWLEEKLLVMFPSLDILYNEKTTIKSELDVYIPSLNLAFELNGIFHYEPIYGTDKLKQIQNNDTRKFQACLENKIELVIIDTSGLKYFKDQNAQKYLDIIQNIIKSKL